MVHRDNLWPEKEEATAGNVVAAIIKGEDGKAGGDFNTFHYVIR